MKRFLLLGLALTAALALSAQPQQVSLDQLPKNSQAFIEKYLAGEKIDVIHHNHDASQERYTVHFANGNEVTFDGPSGECMQLQMRQGSIPLTMLPGAMSNYLEEHYAGEPVKMVERTTDGYRIQLADGKYLHFDKQGALCQKEDSCKKGEASHCKEGKHPTKEHRQAMHP